MRLLAPVGFLVAILSALPATAPALAQSPTAAPTEAASKTARPTVTAAEAQKALEVLQDAARRDALIETLQTIAKTQAPQPSPSPTPSPTPPPTAEEFGAEALLQASEGLKEMSGQIAETVRAATKFPLISLWLVRTVQDPQAEDLLFGLLWRLATVAGVAFGAEYLARLAMRRPFAALEAHAARRVMPVGPSNLAGRAARPTRPAVARRDCGGPSRGCRSPRPASSSKLRQSSPLPPPAIFCSPPVLGQNLSRASRSLLW